MDFGLTLTLEWWKFLLMVLGSAFCWGLGITLGTHLGIWIGDRRR